jgi:SNF2 family DNA or RNA helicase
MDLDGYNKIDSNKNYWKYYYDNLYRVTLKNQIEELKIDIENIIIYTTLSNYEKLIYDTELQIYNTVNDIIRDYTNCLKICCSYNLENIKIIKNIDDFKNVITERYDNIISELNTKMSILINKIAYLKQNYLLVNGEELDYILYEETELNNCIENKKKYINSMSFIEKIKYDENNDNCIICFDIITNKCITICGHLFCLDCIFIVLNNSSNCPICKTSLNRNDIYKISDQKNEELDIHLKKYGTKLTTIISYINNNIEANNKIILFSQWNDCLKLISNILLDNNIKSVICKGNLNQSNAIINKFNNDPTTKILLLSSASLCTGLNLTVANIVIFSDIIYGNPQYIKDIENQAISRIFRIGQTKKIKIIKFVTKDTIEEELYNGTLVI